jgi:hypothetical protein
MLYLRLTSTGRASPEVIWAASFGVAARGGDYTLKYHSAPLAQNIISKGGMHMIIGITHDQDGRVGQRPTLSSECFAYGYPEAASLIRPKSQG